MRKIFFVFPTLFLSSCLQNPTDSELLSQGHSICHYKTYQYVQQCPNVGLLTVPGATYLLDTTTDTATLTPLESGINDFTAEAKEWCKVPIKDGEITNSCLFSDDSVKPTLAEVQAYADACKAKGACPNKWPE